MGDWEYPSDRETCPDRQRRKTKTNKCALKHGVMRITFPTLAEMHSPTTGFSHLSTPEFVRDLDKYRLDVEYYKMYEPSSDHGPWCHPYLLFIAGAKVRIYGCMQDGDQWLFAYANSYSGLEGNCDCKLKDLVGTLAKFDKAKSCV